VVGQGYLFINDTETSVNYTLPTSVTWQTLTGAAAGSSVTIQPFRSVLLLAASGSTAGASPYNLVSGTTSTAQFRSRYGIAADGSGDSISTANNGVANLLKYAFNMIGTQQGQKPQLSQPNTAVLALSGSSGMPRYDVNQAANQFQVTYVRRKAETLPGIAYTVEFSSTLIGGSWATEPGASEQVTSIDATFERVTVTAFASASKRFSRIRITNT